MKVITPLVLILAAVLLPAACQSGNSDDSSQAAGLCGVEYVRHLATKVARRDFPETPGPTFSPSDAACGTLVYSQFATPSPTQPAPVLLDDEGFYTLEDLGYEDIVLHSWEPTIIGRVPGSSPSRYARTYVEYLLPEGAAQGSERWYRFHLHVEVEFAEPVDNASARVSVTSNQWPVVDASFSTEIVDGELIIDASGTEPNRPATASRRTRRSTTRTWLSMVVGTGWSSGCGRTMAWWSRRCGS